MKLLVDESFNQDRQRLFPRSFEVLSYPSAIDLSTGTLRSPLICCAGIAG